MRQRLIGMSLLLILCLISDATLGAAENHLAELKSKFPYGLLGDDHGILAMGDLAINACGAYPEPFSLATRNFAYQYWQCFESKNISLVCSSNGVSYKRDGVMALVTVKASIKHVRHEYIERRLWPMKDCKGFLKDARALLKGTQYACISGSFIDSETDKSSRQTISWVFERIKTKTGCEGHFCDFAEKLKQDKCPDLK